MSSSIRIKNTDLLVKYLNCLERVLFIDNKWMKDYQDIKNGKEKDYEGVSLYLNTLLKKYFEKNNLEIFKTSLPELSDKKEHSEEAECVILESESKSSFLDDEEATQYIVVACPKLEKVFNFKIKDLENLSLPILSKSSISNFSYHPNLPRIKLYSRNFKSFNQKTTLSELKFMYTNPDDAQIKASSLKIINNNLIWDELVPDPSYGVQIGNLAVYFICSIKIKELRRNIENLKQLVLVCEDFQGKEVLFHITTNLYRKLYNEIPEEKVFEKPKYLRTLVFQGFGEDFRHILTAEHTSNEEFLSDSFFAFVRFRKVVSKQKIRFIPKDLPIGIEEKEEFFYYFPNNFKSEMFEVQEQFKRGNRYINYKLLRDYDDFSKICSFHVGWLESYKEKKDFSKNYNHVIVLEQNPYGVHKELLKDPLIKLVFFTKNKRANIFCLNCKKFLNVLRLRDIPLSCPLCSCKVLVMLNNPGDIHLFDSVDNSNLNQESIAVYNRLGTLFISYNKWLYYVMISTGYALNTCVKILNEFRDKKWLEDEEIFFEKLLKIKEIYNKSEGVHNIIYRMEKNEV